MSKDSPLQSVEVELGGKTYTVRPLFKIIAAIEAATGVGAFPLGIEVTNGRVQTIQMAQILYQMLRDQGGPSYEEIGDEIMERGMEPFLVPVGTLLLRSFKGNSQLVADDAGEGEAPTTH